MIATEKSRPDKNFDDELVLYEPNGSERFRIRLPQVTQFSKPDKARFYYVNFLKDDTAEVFFDESGDGHDYRATLNLETGELTDFKKTRV